MRNYNKFYNSWKKFIIQEQVQSLPNIELEPSIKEQPWYQERKQQYGEEAAAAFAKYLVAKQQGQPENVLNALRSAYKQADQKSQTTQQQAPGANNAVQANNQSAERISAGKSVLPTNYKESDWYKNQLQKYGPEAADAFAAVIANPENAKDPEKFAALKANYMKAIGAAPEQQAAAAQKAKAEADAAQARLDKQRADHDKQMKDMMAGHTDAMNKLSQQAQTNKNATVNALSQQNPQAGQVREIKTCPNCGYNKLPVTRRFCSKCGAKQ